VVRKKNEVESKLEEKPPTSTLSEFLDAEDAGAGFLRLARKEEVDLGPSHIPFYGIIASNLPLKGWTSVSTKFISVSSQYRLLVL